MIDTCLLRFRLPLDVLCDILSNQGNKIEEVYVNID